MKINRSYLQLRDSSVNVTTALPTQIFVSDLRIAVDKTENIFQYLKIKSKQEWLNVIEFMNVLNVPFEH